MGYKIAHIGAFDFDNYGDLLFTDVLEKQLKKRINLDEIIYFSPKTCTIPNRDIITHSVTQLEKIYQENKFDAIVVGGGDLVHLQKIMTYMPHISDEWVWYEVLYMWVIPSIVSWKYNIPLIWNAPGVPLKFSELDKPIVRALCQCIDYISVRDEQAKKVLSAAVDSKKIQVVPDTVLSISKIIKKEELLQIFQNLNMPIDAGKYIFFQCNVSLNDEDIDNCAKTLLQIQEKTGYQILLQPIGYALGDRENLEKMNRLYPGKFILSNQHRTQYEILALVAHAALYVGTSLHGCITSNAYGVSNIVYNLNHFNKTDGFVELIQNESSRVYESKDIWEAYQNIADSKKNLEECYDKIERHFDLVAEFIKKGKSQKEVELPTIFAEYIYQSREAINEQKNKITAMQIEVENKKTELINMEMRMKQLEINIQNYREEYLNILNSSAWKVTAPLRKLKDFMQKDK